MSEHSETPRGEDTIMKPEQVELLTMETEAMSQQTLPGMSALPPKALRPAPRAPRIVLTTLFILFGSGLLAATIAIPISPSNESAIPNPCPEVTAFSVNIPFGSLSYNAVKVIDAVWNLAVGRGLQAFATWLCYKIFGMALLRMTQQNQVTTELYAAISFHPLEIRTIPELLRATTSKCGWRGRATFIWLVAAIIYVLTLPTILDLMTGYIATSTAMVHLGGELVPLNYTSSFSYDQSQYFSEDSYEWIYGHNGVTCVPGNTYQWGFSTTWTMVVVTVTTVWCWGMFGLWFDAQKNCLLWWSGRRPGLYRDILDISNALQETLGPDTCAYSNHELTKEVGKIGPVGFEAVSDGSTGYITLRPEPVGCAALRDHGVEYGRMIK